VAAVRSSRSATAARAPDIDAPGTSGGAFPPPILEDPNRALPRAILHGFYGALWWLAIVLGSPWWGWRSLTDKTFRRMALARLGWGLARRSPGAAPRILIHGVSVGEVKAAQSLVEAIGKGTRAYDVVISTTTDTGFEVARELFADHEVVRFPVDPGWIVTRFLRRIDPVCVVLVELEIWPNFLRAANIAGIPVAVVNGRITATSYSSYRLFRNLLPQFNRISLFCVQGEEYARRFAALGCDPGRILVTGNVKADSLGDGPVGPGEELLRLLGGAPGQVILTAGSTHPEEELLVVKAWRDHAPETRLVLVPRHPRRAVEIVAALAELGLEAQRLSELRAGEAPDPERPALVDTIGELERVYGLSDVVFIGGSLVPHGGQNMLEPASQGRAVVYGPHVQNFQLEASLLEARGAAIRLPDGEQLGPQLGALARDPGLRRRMGEAGLAAVGEQKGATARTLSALEERCLTNVSGVSREQDSR